MQCEFLDDDDDYDDDDDHKHCPDPLASLAAINTAALQLGKCLAWFLRKNRTESEYKHSLTFRVRPYIGFLNFRILIARTVKRGKLRHHANFHGDQSNRFGDITIFLFLKMATAAMLDFQIFEILTVGTVTNRCEDMATFRFFKMADAAILDL